MQRYVVLDKKVGETPLSCMEGWRAAQPPAFRDVPLTYAGRLDPLASGTLLVLIGEECKAKEQYLALDKEYEVEILFGLSSDSGDTLGLVEQHTQTIVLKPQLKEVCQDLVGDVTLPYPVFSSKPVDGKPLHTWAVAGKLDEIEIPTQTSTVYSIKVVDLTTVSKHTVYEHALSQIESIPPVTELRKALGNDFRRADIRARWQDWYQDPSTPETFSKASIRCVCSSGTYMRSLAEVIGTRCGTNALAYAIHRRRIGGRHTFGPLTYWSPSF